MLKRILLSKALRSLHNGGFASLFVYFAYQSVNYHDNMYPAMLIAGAILSGIVKSQMLAYIERMGKMFTLVITLSLHALSLIAFLQYVVKCNYYHDQLIMIIALGFLPLDGQEIGIFQEVERIHLCQDSQPQTKKTNLRLYSRVGYIFQALGGASIFYLTYKLEEIDYLFGIRVTQLWVRLYFIGLLNSAFYCFFFLHKYDRENKKQLLSTIPQIYHNKVNKIKLLSVVNGFALGLISAPFLVYFLDLKYSLYFDKMALALACFFLLKGMGEELMEKYDQFGKLFKFWNILANFSLLLVSYTIILSPNYSLYLLIICFPVWNISKLKLKQKINISNNYMEKTKLQQTLLYWQRFGTACGVLISGFAFKILYTSALFGYPFFLCGILRQIIYQYQSQATILSQIIYQYQSQANQDADALKSQGFETQRNLSKIDVSVTEIVINQKQSKFEFNSKGKSRNILIVVLLIICLSYTMIIYKDVEIMKMYLSYDQRWILCVSNAKGDKFQYPTMKLFNQSLAHYLVKQNITNVELLNCDSSCISRHSTKGGYYQQLKYGTADSQWVHYASMQYFRTTEQVTNTLSPIINFPKKIQGFSLAWQNPLHYNKIPDQIHPFIITFCERHNFSYAEMPSLNLRGMENQILFIFTRAKKSDRKLYLPLVKKAPPLNYLAIQTNMKMVSSFSHMRQFILYHLHQGIDKFFFYNNDRSYNDSDYYQQTHQVNQFRDKCVKKTPPGYELQVFHEIWQQFYDHIIYIPWRIKIVETNRPNHRPQQQAHKHYTIYFKMVAKFTSRTDFDEYLTHFEDKYLPDHLEDLLQNDHITVVQMSTIQFITMHCYRPQLLIETFQRQANIILPKDYALKSVGLTKLMMDFLIHSFTTINGAAASVGDSRTKMSFYHYNLVNQGNSTKIVVDEWMKKYVKQLKETCRGKCNDSTFKPSCSKEFYDEMIKKNCS